MDLFLCGNLSELFFGLIMVSTGTGRRTHVLWGKILRVNFCILRVNFGFHINCLINPFFVGQIARVNFRVKIN